MINLFDHERREDIEWDGQEENAENGETTKGEWKDGEPIGIKKC